MNKQPEALRLADELAIQDQCDFYKVCEEAALELRWLHEENERLRDAVAAEREACAKVCEERKSKYEERASKSEDKRDIDPEVARIAKMTCDFNAAAIRARSEA